MRPIWSSPENYPRYVGTARGAAQYFPENCEAGTQHCQEFEPVGYIPQVNHTYAYFEATYGVMNEWQVGIAESTCSGVFSSLSPELGGRALLSVDQLSQIAMERAKTSKEAVQIMGALAEEYGFYGESASFEGGSESLIVIDPNEAWVFHILADPLGSSAVWGAARVPDHDVAVVTNMFSIRVMDMEDTDNFLGRADMWTLAERHGYWQRGQPKDFTATFSDGEYAHKYYSGRRAWGVFRLLAPSQNLPAEYDNLKLDAPYPFSVPVDKPVTPLDAMAVLRDWYNGTEFSTGSTGNVTGRGSGAFGSPDRFGNNADDYSVTGNWERTIALYRSSDSYVVQARSWLPNEVGGVIWFGPAAAHATTYVPVMMGMEAVPDALGWPYQGVYNTSTSYWAARNALTIAQVKFDYMIEDIRELQNSLESHSLTLVDDITNKWLADEMDTATLTTLLRDNTDAARNEYNLLHDSLLFKYSDGNLNFWTRGGGFQCFSLGYPVWWLDVSGYRHGPPPVDVDVLEQKEYVQKWRANFKRREQEARAAYALERGDSKGVLLAHGTTQPAAVTTDLRSCVKRCDTGGGDESFKMCTKHCLEMF